MKEFKFDVNGIAIPIVNCETQIEFTKAVSSFRYSGGKLGVEAHEDEYVCNIYIIYKDGTCYYHNGVDKDEGKYKRTGIKSGIITDDNSAIVFGSFAINEYGNISIDESDIEEYGVYAGQYDVKEEPEAVVEAVETEEKAEEEIITMTNTNASIAKAEEKKTQFDFYNVTIGFEVEKFIGTIPADYESLGIYSDYEKAVQAAQAAADEYGAENIYFHTAEIATRNDREVYDRDDYEDFIEERETIRHNWYTLTIVDTGKREHVNLDKPVRLDFKE